MKSEGKEREHRSFRRFVRGRNSLIDGVCVCSVAFSYFAATPPSNRSEKPSAPSTHLLEGHNQKMMEKYYET